MQLPLFQELQQYESEFINAISKAKDVDGFHFRSFYDESTYDSSLLPVTPTAILRILEEKNVSLAGKTIVLVGAGKLVGEPLSKFLITKKPATMIVCTKETKDLG